MGQFIKKANSHTGSPPGTSLFSVNEQEHGAVNCLVYRIMYGGNTAMLFALCLIVAFLLQPVMQVSADTSDVAEVPVTDATLPAEVEAEVVVAEVAVSEAESEPAVSIPETVDEPVVEESETPVPTAEEVPSDVPPTNPESEVPVPEEGGGTTGEEVPQTEDGAVEEDSTDTETVSDDEIATSTELSPEDIIAPLTLTVQSEEMVQFDRSACVTMEGGAFYCQQNNGKDEGLPDGLYAFPDAGGDLEIYLKQAGDFTQLTSNNVDDAAPYFDEVSNSMVWHRMINERYQIMTMDMESGTEEQLTDTSANNMEPTRSGDYIAWQYWTSGAWQIMLYDGDDTIQLTTTADHNLSPSIRNGLVMWHRLAPETEKTIEVYDIKAKEYTTITDDEGGKISNPRMVLVYETEFENGDVITKGYDLSTGEISALATTPAPLPEDIPEPDSTGETRALIQSKPSGAKDDGEETMPTGTGSSTPPVDDIEPGTLVIGATSSVSEISSSTSPQIPVVDLTLDLRPAEPVEIVPEISDVILPVFETPEPTATTTE